MRESFTPEVPIRTARLLLRPLTEEDLPALLTYRGDPEVCRYLPFDAMGEADLRERLRGSWAGITLDAERSAVRLGLDLDGALIGDVTLFVHDRANRAAEVGWVLSPPHEGRGYATEAARALLAAAFDDLEAHRVVARMDPANTASAAVATRIGMRREALLIEDEWFKGEWADTLLYAMLAREYRALAS